MDAGTVHVVCTTSPVRTGPVDALRVGAPHGGSRRPPVVKSDLCGPGLGPRPYRTRRRHSRRGTTPGRSRDTETPTRGVESGVNGRGRVLSRVFSSGQCYLSRPRRGSGTHTCRVSAASTRGLGPASRPGGWDGRSGRGGRRSRRPTAGRSSSLRPADVHPAPPRAHPVHPCCGPTVSVGTRIGRDQSVPLAVHRRAPTVHRKPTEPVHR